LQARLVAERNVIAGNVLLYGATGGEVFVRGLVGERFGVRNSGATAVVEGVGDHGCEYMTGGTVVILGPVGRNLAAGMSGGTAYVLDLHETRLNSEMVDRETLDPEDIELVRHLVGRHVETTDSAVGKALLDAWLSDPDATAARFAKIMPRDYKAVLTARAAALEEGLDADGPETLARIMEASHG
jgi:glutamate synthase (NADPH/NADH) large chain